MEGSGETCKYGAVSMVQLDDLKAIMHELFNDGASRHPKYAPWLPVSMTIRGNDSQCACR